MNYEFIRDILTLRYHPHGHAILPRLDWRSFVEYNGISQFVQPLLEGAIRRIVGENIDKRFGMAISGGIDSTVILALTRKCFPGLEIKTFCVTFGDDEGEAKDAKYASELYSTDHLHVCIENPFQELETQISIVNEPRWNLYPYYLFREAAKYCDILLTGDGGDELFGGYVFRYEHILQGRSSNIMEEYLETHNRDWVPDQEKLFAFPFEWNDIYNLLKPHFDNPLPLLGKIFLADYNGKLMHDFAPTNAHLSEHFRIKTVAPMLEAEVLHVATHVPHYLKYDARNNVGKIVLRQILLENSGYKPSTKGKIGWGMNTSEMWDKYVRDMCEELFGSPRFIELRLINKEWLQSAFRKANEHDVRYVNKMLGLLALELWIRLNGISN